MGGVMTMWTLIGSAPDIIYRKDEDIFMYMHNIKNRALNLEVGIMGQRNTESD